jgi:hypothetical protein
MNFAADVDLDGDAFARLDRIALLGVEGFSSPCE